MSESSDATLQVLVALGVTSATLACVLGLCWRWIDRRDHVLAWALAFGAAAGQWLIALLDLALDAGMAGFWVLSNLLALTMLAALVHGFRDRAGLATPPGLLVGVVLLVEALVVWSTAVVRDPGVAAAIAPFATTVAFAVCGHALLTRSARTNAAERGAVAVLLAFGLAQFAAALVALGSAASAGRMAQLDALLQLTLPAGHAALGAFLILLVAADLSERMSRLAITDPLTDVLNRRGFLDAALRAVSRSRRASEPLTLVMTDIDQFKRVNDTYGHKLGDRALKMFSRHLLQSVRGSDVVGRMGGEEFAVLLPATGRDDAVQVMERLRRELELAAIEAGGARVQLTASFGVAALSPEDGDLEDLVERADRGLYMAKELGRNQVCVAPEGTADPDFATA